MNLLSFSNGNIYRFGTHLSPIYVVTGKQAAIIEGGLLSCYPAAARIIEMAEEYRFSYWVITHSHYDHCGLLPYLRDSLPGCRICASSDAAAALNRSGHCAFVERINSELCREGGIAIPALQNGGPDYTIDQVIQEGDVLDLGNGVELRVVDAKGHSACCIALWLEEPGVLFPADALGACWNPNSVFPLVFHSAEEYIKTIKRLGDLSPQLVLPGHYAPISGNKAQSLFSRALAAVEDFHQTFQSLENHRGKAHAIETISSLFYDDIARNLLPKEFFHQSIESMWQLIREEQ